MYGASFELQKALNYDFECEREFKYSGLSMDEIVRHLAFFVSRLWQIHAFGEGNTRTTAVFTIKYLRSMGFKVGNDIFAKNSWYFRNALVRANYKNVDKKIEEEPEYLEKFFRNLLMGEHNELKNRYLHVDYKKVKDSKNVPVNVPVNVPLKDRQKKIITALSKDPHVSAKKLAEKFGVTEKTIKRDLQLLKQQNLITRVGADKNGYWKVN